ncbi:glucan biosynthesis protein, partial [Leclercia adecarboxylata]|uniref:glucan biosynthesis protein n=1 Tax=Leclercia adecarboxylata TaxID=83655 RepID=UPI00234D6CBB
ALPADLARLGYDGLRDIRWRPERALWRRQGLPFEAMFLHLGSLHQTPVRVHEVLPDGTVRALRYDPADFDYGRNRFDPARWGELGFSGLRLHYPLHGPDYKDELIVFQGASYFRALGRHQQY